MPASIRAQDCRVDVTITPATKTTQSYNRILPRFDMAQPPVAPESTIAHWL